MPLYLGQQTPAICPRCGLKVEYAKLMQDPNTKTWVCGKCRDDFDPWRLPARRTENISLDHPRPDQELV